MTPELELMVSQDPRRIVSITDSGSSFPLVTTAYPFAVDNSVTIVGNSVGDYNGVQSDLTQVSPTSFTLNSLSFTSNGYGGEISATS